MGSRYLNTFLVTTMEPTRIRDTAIQVFQALGGRMFPAANGFTLVDGSYGVNMRSMANLTATLTMRPMKENNYEVQVYLNWAWGSTMWALLIVGFLLGGITWLFLLLYLAYDPTPVYQQMLSRLVNIISYEQ